MDINGTSGRRSQYGMGLPKYLGTLVIELAHNHLVFESYWPRLATKVHTMFYENFVYISKEIKSENT